MPSRIRNEGGIQGKDALGCPSTGLRTPGYPSRVAGGAPSISSSNNMYSGTLLHGRGRFRHPLLFGRWSALFECTH